MSDVANSTGSAKKMYEVYADSVQAKINDLKRSFENLYEKILSSDTLKTLVSGATQIINFLTNMDSSTIKLIGTVTLLGATLKSIGTFTNALKGVETIAELGKGAGVIGSVAKGFNSLGTGISLATKASLGFIATPLGATLTGLAVLLGGAYVAYDSYKEMIAKPLDTPTEELTGLQRIINSLTGEAYKSRQELEQDGIIYEQFGQGISNGFKEGVEKASKTYQEFNLELSKIGNLDNIKVGDENSNKIKSMVDNIVNTAKQSIDSRKQEVSKSLNELFTSDDGSVDEKETNVLNIIGKEADASYEAISSLHDKIYERWNKAIADHGKLSQEDLEVIRGYFRDIQQIEAESKIENNQDFFYAKNKLSSRIKGLSLEDASKEFKEANDKIKDNFAQRKAIYDSGVDTLEQQKQILINKDAEGNKKEIDAIQEQIDEKKGKYEKLIEQERKQRKELVDIIEQSNDKLKGKINVITGDKLSDEDIIENKKIDALKNTYSELGKVQKSGMQTVKDANGVWRDIYVEVDQTTGQILGTYDTYTGKVAGYTKKNSEDMEKFKNDNEKSLNAIKMLFSNTGSFKGNFEGSKATIENLGDGLGNLKINDNVIGQLKNVKQELDGTYTAITSINGQRIEIKTNSEGVITNLGEVANTLGLLPEYKTIQINADGKVEIVDIIKGKIDELPDSKECKVTIDGQDETNIDAVIEKLGQVPPDTKTDIVINGEQVTTAGKAKEKLEAIPKETNSDIKANNTDANSKANDTKEKLDEVDNKDTNSDLKANNTSALTSIGSVFTKLYELTKHPWTTTVTTVIKTVKEFFSGDSSNQQIPEKKYDEHGNPLARGTDNATKGWHDTAEEGFEIMVGRKHRWFNGGEKVLDHKKSVEFLKQINKDDFEEGEEDGYADGTDYARRGYHNTSERGYEVKLRKKKPKKPDVIVPANNDGGYFPTLQGGGGSSSSGGDGGYSSYYSNKEAERAMKKAESEAKKAQKKAEADAKRADKFRGQIERLGQNLEYDFEIDPYYSENNNLKEVENQITKNKTLMEGLKKDSKEYQDAQEKDIELYKEKKDRLAELIMAQETEASVIKEKLSQYSFVFDENGKLINSETRLLELKNSIVAQSGDTEEAKQKKQDDIKWLKELTISSIRA